MACGIALLAWHESYMEIAAEGSRSVDGELQLVLGRDGTELDQMTS
jgi:hypothetical protein